VTPLPHSLERTIVIGAEIETVFKFFTDPALWAEWWGAGSTIDPRPGGDLRICHSNGFVSVGNVLEISPPNRFAFTFSLQTNPPTRAEDSRVTIRLSRHSDGTQLMLTHELASAAVRDLMHQGWRFQLSLFSNAVADLVNAGAASRVDDWFALWTEPDAAARQATLDRIAVPVVRFRDRHSALEGSSEIVAHIGASQRFMPGIALKRRGGVRHCQGTVLADWSAVSTEGVERISGTNVFVFGADGKLVSVTGIPAEASKS
jgi:uncharacterized protein YndB with AHSA1/START domain